MRQPLHSQGEERHTQFSPDARWRQVLRLGEQLLSKVGLDGGANYEEYPERNIIPAQCGLIIRTAEELLDGVGELWLPRWLGLEIGYLSRKVHEVETGVASFAAGPPTELMCAALDSRRIRVGQTSVASPSEAVVSDGLVPAMAMAAPFVVAPDSISNETGPAQVFGVLQIERPQGPPFDEHDILLFEGLASQAALALQVSRQAAVERWRVEQLSLVRQVSQQLVQMHNLDELTRRVTRLIQDTFDYYFVAIFTIEPGQEVLHFRDSAGPGRGKKQTNQKEVGRDLSPVLNIRMGEGMVGNSAQSGLEILANDVSRESRYRHVDALPETRAEFTLPLKIEDRVLGVLDVQSDQPDDFHQIDVLVLRALAGSIALAVDSTRLYCDLQRRAEYLATVSEVSSAITSILDQEQLLQRVVELIYDRFGYAFVHLFSVHPGRRKIFYEAGSGARNQALSELSFAYDLDDSHGMIPWVARQGQTLLANDVGKEPHYRPSPLPPEETRSELTVPLKFGGQVLGVLDIQSDQLNAFVEDDRFLFEALADNIAIAMRNASLYRSERWRRQVAESLQQVAGLLSAEVELSQVLRATLAELERNLPCDLAAIWLLDRNWPEGQIPEVGFPPLRLAAVKGADSGWLESQVGLNLDEVFANDNGLSISDLAVEPANWLLEAIHAEQPVIRDGGQSQDILGAALEYMPNYSAIAVPLKAGDQRLGVLTLMHHTAGRYGSEAQAMTAAFASYAAIAIENTRLFEDAHEQVWVSTVLLQVAEATQSASDLNELLSTVVNITPLLVGVKACAIYVMDEDGRFLPAAAGGLNAENQAAFTSERFAPGDSPALDKLVGEKQPTLLRRQGEDARLSNIIAGEEEGSDVLEFLILVPLVAHGDLLGAMLVSYHNDPYKGMLQDLEAFFDERLPIIQGIAHQTAMAMENVRLMKAQREEAYVSVALLQVAQVVVSSNELDEALAAIVRITPILTGMKRVAIYLWVAESASFHLAQAYGFPRGAQIYEYCLDEFPLLEAAYTQNRLTMYPVQRAQRDWDDVPEVWTYLPAAEEDEQEDFLHNEAKLLLALPLAVKGSVMGVMLVEEPDPAPAQGLDGGNANRRMRAKRLEIATGISQQVALAIQNEQLQREQVLRERLEREMQLAREIQRTFLPQELPELPGWEIEVWWRSAREMSGDFYDFFDLPGGKLGLVIADVADKGMPAALFMTLIRTLLRAEARDSNSPAEVLAGVNALLVPDAQKGMFVTLVYGVLDPESGVLTYANAGHNPPLWVKKQAVEIESLNKSGMALGVYEGSEIDDRMIHLQPGDYLVLYTDGVTEAFSPDWTIYSADRLCSTVWEAAFGIREKTITSVEQVGAPAVSAKAMLAAIDASVEEFVGGAAPADDSTVIVLMRQGN